MNRHEFIDWYEDVRVGTRRLISMTPEDALEFTINEQGTTIEMLLRAFASLEEQYVRGVCMDDWGGPSSPRKVKERQMQILAEETDDLDIMDVETLETPDDILNHLDSIHDEALNILADISDDEFQHRRVDLPWGEGGTISRLLLGLVEREIHHRTELFLALGKYGLKMSDQIIWGP